MINSLSRTTAHRALAAAGLLASGAMLLTACSSSSSATATAASSAGASASSAAGNGMAAYRTCLSQHGVTLPSGRPSGSFSHNPNAPRPSHSSGYGGGYGGGGYGGYGGASANPSTAAAMQACASLRPKGGGFGGGKGLGGTALAAFTSCMKDNGVTVNAAGLGALLKSTDAKTVAALKVCKPLLPTRGGNGAPSPSPSA